MNDSNKSPNLSALLAAAAPAKTRKWRRLAWAAGLVVVLAAVVPFALPRPPAPLQFTTQPLRRGDIQLTITATGSLAPTNEVTVGSELSGTVLEVYADTNDRVTKGQPLAKLDTTKLEQQIAASRAAVGTAEAKVVDAQATVQENAATLARQQELHRVSGGRMPSQADLAAAEAAATRARAALASAEAAVAQARAELSQKENDLSKAIIRSPIDGLVLTRAIEPGQTVAASFTAPELFVIAESLEQMKLEVSVAEADIGRVKEGQPARFTVDAWPDQTYLATVKKVSYGSTVSSNVVTYSTELEVSNGDLTLRPGMTATADIDVASSRGVLLVPAAALRFTPAQPGATAPQASKSFVQSLMPMPPRPQSTKKAPDGNAARAEPGSQKARVHVLRDGQPVPVEVLTGLNDGRFVEVSSPDLAEGDAIITRATAAQP